ncbi:MAG: hypothetical protein RL517_1420 [Pseudomonadota bacterium]|jgi:hypothetical protein
MMKLLSCRIQLHSIGLAIGLTLIACAGDPLESGLDPYAPMIYKEGTTAMPLNPPNKSKLQPFYVSPQTIFKFEVDTSSILVGNDGITRYIVVLTSPNGNTQAQYEGIRCNSFQWRLYGTFESGVWRENPLSNWRDIQEHAPNRYQAALAQGAFCDLSSQEKNINNILQSLNPNSFTGQIRLPN